MIWTCNIFLYSVTFVISTVTFHGSLAKGNNKWTRETYPNPYIHPRNCSRATRSYVCDPDEILLKGQADKLDTIIWRIKNETPCLCEVCEISQGITIAVALMKTMSNISNLLIADTVIADSAETFATYLRRRWNFGQCDDDVLLFVSSVDQKFHASIGNTVTATLDKNLAFRIFQVNRDHFLTGYYYQGLESIMESYYDVLRQHHNNPKEDKHTNPSSPIPNKDIIVALVISVIVLIALAILITIIIYNRTKIAVRKIEGPETGNSLTRWHASRNKKLPDGDYERCNADDHCDDDNSSEGSSVVSEADSELLSDVYQMNRMYNISKRQLSAVPEESENDDEEEVENYRTRTSSLPRKSSANGISRIPQLQDSTEE